MANEILAVFISVLFFLSKITFPLVTIRGAQATVEGVVVDISNARIANATVTFGSGVDESNIKTQQDGTYSIMLKPGTYKISVSKPGFCPFRRAGFVLPERSSVRFGLQMWVCPTDFPHFIQYAELDEVPHTNLKPLMLFGETEPQGELQHFYGRITPDDGTGHARKYPVVLTFNLLTVKADEIIYLSSDHTFKALGNVVWEDNDSIEPKAVDYAEVKLDGFTPKPIARYVRPGGSVRSRGAIVLFRFAKPVRLPRQVTLGDNVVDQAL